MSPNEPTRLEPEQPVDSLLTRASSEGEADSYSGKRRWSRWKAGLTLEVTSDPSNPNKSHHVSMHDVSRGGVGIWLRTQWPARSEIYIREAGQEPPAPWLRGCVKHATRGLRGYLIGVELDEPLPQ